MKTYRFYGLAALCAVALTVPGPAGATSEFGNFLAGRHAQAQNDAEKASSFMLRVLEDNPDDRELLRTTFLLTLSAGNFPVAVDLADKLDRSGSKMPTVGLLLGVEAARKGDYDGAREYFDALPRRGLSTYAGPLATAWANAGAGKYDAALEALSDLDKKSGFAAMRELHAGLINDMANRLEPAETHYRAVTPELHKAPVRVVRAAGSLLERTGRREEAGKLYRDFLEGSPGNVAIEATLEMFERGETAPPLVADAKAGIAESLFNIASALPRDRSADMAMVYSRMALYLRPDFELARLLIGDLFDNQRRYADANAAYKDVDPSSPYSWSARLRVADNLADMGETDRAVDTLRAMSAEKTDRIDALLKLGGILRRKERYEDAVKAYDAVEPRLGEIQSGHWLYFYNRGIALERSKLWDRAEKDFLKALELRPEQPYVLNYLGYSWVEKGMHIERARGMIERAVEQRQDDGYIVDSLGWVLYRLGEYDASVKQLERAIRLRPSDPVINDHLGDAYWRVGRKLEARFQWRRALGLEPSGDLIPDIEAKLEGGLKETEPNRPGG